MICPNCGTESSGKFCPRCGSPLEQKQAQAEPESAQVQETPVSAEPTEPLQQAQETPMGAEPTEPLQQAQETPVSAEPTEPIAAEAQAPAAATQAQMPQDAYGQAQAPQDAYAQAQAPQDAYGQAQAPQDAYAQAQAPQDAYAQAQAPQDAYGQGQQVYGAMPQGVPPQPQSEPWYGKTWVIVLFLLFFWPVGIVLMWMKSCKWAKGAKIGVTVALALLVIGGIASSVVLMNQINNMAQSTPTRSSSISKSSSASSSSASSSSSSSSKSSLSSSSTKSGSSQANSAITTDCIDSSGNPSLYAISQLDGKSLGELLEDYIGYSWNASEGGWVYSGDNTVVAVMNQSSTLGKSDIEKIAAAGGDTPTMYVVTVAKITTLDQALSEGNVVVEDRFTQTDGSGAAVFYGPNMKEMMVIGTPDTDGTNYGNFSMLIFNRKAFESGLAAEKLGAGSQGMTMEQFWETMTGKKLNN